MVQKKKRGHSKRTCKNTKKNTIPISVKGGKRKNIYIYIYVRKGAYLTSSLFDALYVGLQRQIEKEGVEGKRQ